MFNTVRKLRVVSALQRVSFLSHATQPAIEGCRPLKPPAILPLLRPFFRPFSSQPPLPVKGPSASHTAPAGPARRPSSLQETGYWELRGIIFVLIAGGGVLLWGRSRNTRLPLPEASLPSFSRALQCMQQAEEASLREAATAWQIARKAAPHAGAASPAALRDLDTRLGIGRGDGKGDGGGEAAYSLWLRAERELVECLRQADPSYGEGGRDSGNKGGSKVAAAKAQAAAGLAGPGAGAGELGAVLVLTRLAHVHGRLLQHQRLASFGAEGRRRGGKRARSQVVRLEKQLEGELRQALALLATHLGKDSSRCIPVLRELALLYAQQGRHGEAKALLLRCLQVAALPWKGGGGGGEGGRDVLRAAEPWWQTHVRGATCEQLAQVCRLASEKERYRAAGAPLPSPASASASGDSLAPFLRGGGEEAEEGSNEVWRQGAADGARREAGWEVHRREALMWTQRAAGAAQAELGSEHPHVRRLLGVY